MANYAKHLSTKTTPQNEAIPGKNQVKNSAGGYVFEVSDEIKLERFLILGSEGGSYYCSERKLTQTNAEAVIRLIKKDGIATVNKIVEISDSGRAPKNSPAIFALALAITHGDENTKLEASKAVQKVCRTGTHILEFAAACDELRGWGRSLKRAVSSWYTDKTADNLAYQVAKYQQRNGWSHRDVLRLSHPQTTDNSKQAVLRWVTRGADQLGEVVIDRKDNKKTYPATASLPKVLEGFEIAKKSDNIKEIVRLIGDYNLPRECIPTKFLNEISVWEALLEKMPVTAMIRNLGVMSKIGLIAPLSNATKKIRSTLFDKDKLRKGRVHPLNLLVAHSIYSAGKGLKGSNSWTPDQTIVSSLNEAFYLAFGIVTPTNKRWLLALDVSGSMGGGNVCGSFLTPRAASAAMALVTANIEKDHHIVGFTAGSNFRSAYNYGSSIEGLTPLPINRTLNLNDVVKYVSGLPFERTDCSLPMRYALEKKIPVDAFVVYTDSETWFGNIHPVQALTNYRKEMNIDAKLIVVGMIANSFSIADPNDVGMLDVVGFDTSVPQVISDFVGGTSQYTENEDEDEPENV